MVYITALVRTDRHLLFAIEGCHSSPQSPWHDCVQQAFVWCHAYKILWLGCFSTRHTWYCWFIYFPKLSTFTYSLTNCLFFSFLSPLIIDVQLQAGPRLAKVKVDGILTAPHETAVLYPEDGGNMHCFTAQNACAVLDVLGPPYDDGSGRHCQYYNVRSSAISVGKIFTWVKWPTINILGVTVLEYCCFVNQLFSLT